MVRIRQPRSRDCALQRSSKPRAARLAQACGPPGPPGHVPREICEAQRHSGSA